MKKEYVAFYNAIKTTFSHEKIFTSLIHRIAYGADASVYQYIPEIVFKPTTEQEVIEIISLANSHDLSYTFKAAGTSLSGQVGCDSILIVAREGFEKIEILDNEGMKIRIGVGVIAGHANQELAKYNRKIGPDPGTINQAMIGGIVSNNSSGMCCGVDKNTYKTIDSIRLILVDGTILDTSISDNVKSFRETHKDLLSQLNDIALGIKSDTELSKLIHKKYKIKNTTGYSLNALVDYSDPIDILVHLAVGSEGTIGFISEVVYNTIEELPFRACSMMYFKDINECCSSIVEITKLNNEAKLDGKNVVQSAELIDRQGLRSVQYKENIPSFIKDFGTEVTALLLDVKGNSKQEVDDKILVLNKLLSNYKLERPQEFTYDKDEIDLFWKVRKGLLPAMGNIRAKGTAVLVEDLAFPLGKLAEGTKDLITILKKHDYYDNTVIFGHALDSNLHFVFSQKFENPEEITKYKNMMDDIIENITTKYDGSLKAEHGTGRNMAPFVEKEWGRKAYDIMLKIKNIFDPKNNINPDVMFTNNPNLHLENFKHVPVVDDLMDKCIECGFCEHVCPSRDITLTPRQRNIIARQIERYKQEGKHDEVKELKAFDYEGIETCMRCGLCYIECPVDINTGLFIKSLELEQRGTISNTMASLAKNNISLLSTFLEKALKFEEGKRSHKKIISQEKEKRETTEFEVLPAKKVRHLLPKWDVYSPTSNTPNYSTFMKNNVVKETDKKIVYISSCMNRMIGLSALHDDQRPLYEVVSHVLNKLNYSLILPKKSKDVCCGLAFSSKSFPKQSKDAYAKYYEVIVEASENGKYPILMDLSTCSTHIRQQLTENDNITVYDSVNFLHDVLIPELENIKKKQEPIAIHATCSSRHMNEGQKTIAIAESLAEHVVVPLNVECCGASGDRWISTPEVADKSTRALAPQVKDCIKGYSTNSGCENNLTKHSGKQYYSLWHLLEEVIS